MCSALPVCGNKADTVKKEDSAPSMLGFDSIWPARVQYHHWLSCCFPEEKNLCCPVCLSLSQELHTFPSQHPFCGWAFPPNHSATEEALVLAIARWFPPKS